MIEIEFDGCTLEVSHIGTAQEIEFQLAVEGLQAFAESIQAFCDVVLDAVIDAARAAVDAFESYMRSLGPAIDRVLSAQNSPHMNPPRLLV